MAGRVIGLPAGYRDVLHAEARARRAIEGKFASAFNAAGYGEVSPSAVEFLEVYTRGNQSTKDGAFKFLDRDDHLLALRADYTPAIARMVASGALGDAPPYRVWYCGNVFRRADLNRGRFHEFRQIGAELLGVNSFRSDLEIITLALHCLSAAGIADFQLHINHAGIFRGIISALGLDEEELRRIKTEIDRKDARGVATRLESLGVARELRDQLNLLSRLIGEAAVLKTALGALHNPVSRAAAEELLALADGLKEWKRCIVFDLTEIDDMEYYTGMMCKFFSPKSAGELGGGGRYDALLGEFGKGMPAVGFSFSMDRLVEIA